MEFWRGALAKNYLMNFLLSYKADIVIINHIKKDTCHIDKCRNLLRYIIIINLLRQLLFYMFSIH